MKVAVGTRLITGALLKKVEVIGSMRTTEATLEVITLDLRITTVVVSSRNVREVTYLKVVYVMGMVTVKKLVDGASVMITFVGSVKVNEKKSATVS